MFGVLAYAHCASCVQWDKLFSKFLRRVQYDAGLMPCTSLCDLNEVICRAIASGFGYILAYADDLLFARSVVYLQELLAIAER